MAREVQKVNFEPLECIYPLSQDETPHIRITQNETMSDCKKIMGSIGDQLEDSKMFYIEIPTIKSEVMKLKIGKDSNTWYEVSRQPEVAADHHAAKYAAANLYKFIKLQELNNNYEEQ